MTAKEHAQSQRQRAKDLLSKQLLSMMNIHNVEADGMYLGVVDEIVDCIIGATILETAVLQQEAMVAVREK